MSGHGGTRTGAGRPKKWAFVVALKIGQACERKWGMACETALAARSAALPYAGELTALHIAAQAIPVAQRKAWLAGDGYGDHSGDIKAFLHARVGTPFNQVTGEYDGEAPRCFTISTKPPRGTRQRILGEVAAESGLSESTVDNLWQQYRRFEQDCRNDTIPPET